MLILFPSSFACPISTELAEDRVDIHVNVCGELWLPFYATCDEGFQEASTRGKYHIARVDDATIEIWAHHPDVFRVKTTYPSHRLVRYDNENRRMADVFGVLDTSGVAEILMKARLLR